LCYTVIDYRGGLAPYQETNGVSARECREYMCYTVIDFRAGLEPD